MCAKRLLLIRHAKSSWTDSSLADFERPLNSRGKRDAPFMGELLNKKNIYPDLIMTSYAERSKRTAQIIAGKLGYSDEKILIDERLYEANYKDILDVIRETKNNIKVLFVFGHNPGLTTLHNFLCESYIDNIPTCGITEYEIGEEWKNLSAKSVKLLSFEYPKKYFKN